MSKRTNIIPEPESELEPEPYLEPEPEEEPEEEPEVEPEIVTLIIPPFLQNSLNCFTASRENDVSHHYKIAFKTPYQQPLYVDNELDLRDTLKQYCLYKHLYEKIDEEMKSLDLEFTMSENTVRLGKSPQDSVKSDYYRSPPTTACRTGHICEPECGRLPRVKFPPESKLLLLSPEETIQWDTGPTISKGEAGTPQMSSDQSRRKRKCCTIL